MINKIPEIIEGHPRDPSKRIRKIFLEKDALKMPLTRSILDRSGTIPFETIKDQESLNAIFANEGKSFAAELSHGKQYLLLSRNRGRFFKPCPATREYRCCDYQVLNIGMNCPMDCVYCILQAYLNNPWLSFFVNTEDLFAEMNEAFSAEPGRRWRIGTGEFTDSMALDSLTCLSRDLVNFMRDKNNAVLELKTKTACIENLKGLDHNGRTIVAWSLNSPEIMEKEELLTATMEQRLAAAAECADLGYRLAFHFDPIIHHEGWRDGYHQTIEKLFASVPAEKISWISMGCLRYLPSLKNIATSRFPNSIFFYNEFVPGLDNKFRYFRTLREEMYEFIYKGLRKSADDTTCIYMCMESDEIWRKIFGFVPKDHGGLPAMLDRAAGLSG